jgi:flagellar motor switch protein FliG
MSFTLTGTDVKAFEGSAQRPPRRASFALGVVFLSLGVFGLSVALAQVEAPDSALVEREAQLKATAEAQIQKQILDPILGQGRAMDFVDVELEQITQREEQAKQGTGFAQKYKEKGIPGGGSLGLNAEGQSQFILPGVPQPKFLSRLRAGGNTPPEQAAQQAQSAAKEVSEQHISVKTIVKKFQVTIIHDDTIPKEKIDMVRQRIIDAFSQYGITADRIFFRPTKFVSSWMDDLKNPRVYVPLIFAALLLLFLMFLFGPFSLLLGGLVKALREKGATEVTVDSRFEGGPEGQGAMGMAAMEGALEGALEKKKKEEEEEEMKKFEPFSYINEENIKRLSFLLRHEEAWVASVVLEYLKPEYAHTILSALPLELQAKVAFETATIRQLTREQVMAIDDQIREKVNFVLGGVGHLIQMIEDSDEATRQNLLEYLKNEKPAVYDKIRKGVLLFEDIPGFQDRDLQAVIRSLKTEVMARSLMGAHPDIVNKFLTNMSTGASALLKEEMEYTKDLTPAQVEEERRKVMQIIKSLEREGKIHVRQKIDDFALEGLEEVPPTPGLGKIALPGAGTPALAMAQPQSAQAQSLMAQAVAAFQGGRYADCLTQAAEALRLDPGLWQAYSFMGYAAYSLGRVEQAIGYYEQFYQHNPDPALRSWLDAFEASIGKKE